ncbi:alpha/beta fold hydrolase [Antrihabitans sp. YC3-6]|uniref:Alpha/beta fold hydrolase n=1 Tax=Antrihabitans stalagmiti TaxID=2799499 RepID=A0A934U089_9NOCA|nr:alpha/beta fold hydrolase [Antrihabitans stalagmiti]MBJ8337307.1 alpha/beta fold hydrolase [Antrihabitans stalagmiti]
MKHQLVAGVFAVVVSATVAMAPTVHAAEFPVTTDGLAAVVAGIGQPDVAPPGANRPSCRSTAHPTPVVLVHGAGLNQNANWAALAPTLANNGYCVFTLTYGRTPFSLGSGAVDSLFTSAEQLGAFVDQVRAWTGADRVDLVGHSQGAAVQRIYTESNPAAVRRVIGLAASYSRVTAFEGITYLVDTLPALQPLLSLGCPACEDLNNPATYPPPVPTVLYHNIISVTDEVITPYTVGFLPPGPNVVNQTVQSVCPDDEVGHLGIAFDPATLRMVLNALSPDDAVPVVCDQGLPI